MKRVILETVYTPVWNAGAFLSRITGKRNFPAVLETALTFLESIMKEL